MPTIDVKIKGIRPLLMNNARAIDELDPLVREIKEFDGLHKSKKTDEGRAAADERRFIVALYINQDGYPFLPAENFYACLCQAARIYKLGTKAKSGLGVLSDSPLIGVNKTAAELVEDKSHWFRKSTGRGVMSVRPIFHEWAGEFTIEYIPEIIGKREVETILSSCGRVGIGDWRSLFGKFEVSY